MTPRARMCIASTLCLIGVVTAVRVPQLGAAHGRTYVVQSDDTLSAIAYRLHRSQRELMRLNGIADPDHLQVGQVLTVPEGSDEWRDAALSGQARSTVPAPPSVDPPATRATTYVRPGAGSSYVVRPGDTLGALSARFGVSLAALARANGIDRPELLLIGQRLLIPGAITTGSRTGAADVPYRSPSTTAPILTAPTTTTPISPVSATAIAPRPAASGTTVGALLASQAQAYGIDPALVKAVAWQESGWRMVVAPDGGIGVMQLMPATAAWAGPALLGRVINPYNLADNIQAGVALLASYLHQYGDVRTALVAYNAGPGAVTSGIGAATTQYIADVLALRGGFVQ